MIIPVLSFLKMAAKLKNGAMFINLMASFYSSMKNILDGNTSMYMKDEVASF
jgi:hypothetical protein